MLHLFVVAKVHLCCLGFLKRVFQCYSISFSYARLHLYKCISLSPQFQIVSNQHLYTPWVEIFQTLSMILELVVRVCWKWLYVMAPVRRPIFVPTYFCRLNSIFSKNNCIGFSLSNFQSCLVKLCLFISILTFQLLFGDFYIWTLCQPISLI